MGVTGRGRDCDDFSTDSPPAAIYLSRSSGGGSYCSVAGGFPLVAAEPDVAVLQRAVPPRERCIRWRRTRWLAVCIVVQQDVLSSCGVPPGRLEFAGAR